MSVKIRISYTDENELRNLLNKLQPDVKKCKVSREQKGEHYNAYITLKNAAVNENNTCNKPDAAI